MRTINFLKTSLIHYLALGLFAILTISACKEDPSGDKEPETKAPALSLEISEITQNSARLIFTTDHAEEYAYLIETKGENVSDVQEVFEKGTLASFEGKTDASIVVKQLKADTEYTVYAAAREGSENDFLYSDLTEENLATQGITETITLIDADYTSYSYHIEVPEGKTYKHISVRKVDFDWLSANVGATKTSYVEIFGYEIKSSEDFAYDRYFVDFYDGPVNIYPDDEYMILATEMGPDGQAVTSTTESLVFRTRKPAESPYDIKAEATDITSTTAKVNIIPDEGIEFYRWNVQKKSDFDFVAKEGEMSVRSMILGDWPNTEMEAKAEITVELSHLLPNTTYIAGIIGFDADFGMRQVMYEFNTTEPTGPKPEISIKEMETETPYNSACFVLQLANAASGTVDVHTKAQYDEVLSRPDVTLDMVVANNGTPLSQADLQSASTGSGLECRFTELQPSTVYVFGAYAMNDESVAVVDTIHFTTAPLPSSGGNVRENMPGIYTATITNVDGEVLTFPVEIRTGVNDATEQEYSAKNRLVCLGFGMPEYQHVLPEDLIEEGYSEEEANFNYGPKWFIEFQPDGTITTPQVIDYDFDFDMYNYNGSRIRFCGYAKRSTGTLTDMQCAFPVEVSEDGNTITVKPFETVSEWSGETFIYYPGAMLMSSQWSGEPALAGASELVLVRNK